MKTQRKKLKKEGKPLELPEDDIAKVIQNNSQ